MVSIASLNILTGFKEKMLWALSHFGVSSSLTHQLKSTQVYLAYTLPKLVESRECTSPAS